MQNTVFRLAGDYLRECWGFSPWLNASYKALFLAEELVHELPEDAAPRILYQVMHDIAAMWHVDVDDLLHPLGRYLFPRLLESMPVTISHVGSAQAFLAAVDPLDMVEVQQSWMSDSGLCLTAELRCSADLHPLVDGLLCGLVEFFDTPVDWRPTLLADETVRYQLFFGRDEARLVA